VFRNPDGATLRMVGTVADVTQRHEFAAQLLHSERLEATGRLAGSVAHDFNNLLTIIVGQADLARRTLAPDEAMRDALDQITLAAERAAVFPSPPAAPAASYRLAVFVRCESRETSRCDTTSVSVVADCRFLSGHHDPTDTKGSEAATTHGSVLC
jgi:hypothetical protein